MYAVRSKAEIEFKNDVTNFFKSENFLTKEQHQNAQKLAETAGIWN